MSFPQIYQSADMNTPASERGTAAFADQKSDPPANLGDMLNPDEKFKPKKMSAIQRVGIRKSAEYRGLPPEMAEAYILEMEKQAISLGLAAKAVGSRLLGKGGGGLFSRIKSAPKVLGRAFRSKVKPAVTSVATRGTVTRRPGTAGGGLVPLSPTRSARTQMPAAGQGRRHAVAQKPTVSKPAAGTGKAAPAAAADPAVITPGRHQRMEHMMSGKYKSDPAFKSLLGKEQTGMEKFYQKWKTPIDIAPWIALPLASQVAGLGPVGDLAAFGGAMALPGMMGKRFGAGLTRAKASYLAGKSAPSLKPAMA